MQNSIQKSRGIKSADTRSERWPGVPGRGKEFLPETPGRRSLHCKKSQQVKTLQSSKSTAPPLKRIACQQARCGSINILELRVAGGIRLNAARFAGYWGPPDTHRILTSGHHFPVPSIHFSASGFHLPASEIHLVGFGLHILASSQFLIDFGSMLMVIFHMIFEPSWKRPIARFDWKSQYKI